MPREGLRSTPPGSLCALREPHDPHEWIDGVIRRDCPGICVVCGEPFKVCDDCGPRPVRGDGE